jgi:hypothetical protein
MLESLRRYDEELAALQMEEKRPPTDEEAFQAVIDHINWRLAEMPDYKDIS